MPRGEGEENGATHLETGRLVLSCFDCMLHYVNYPPFTLHPRPAVNMFFVFLVKVRLLYYGITVSYCRYI
jgi:hypothetical protein